MADWIKVRHALVRSAKIRLMARELGCNQITALGLAVKWLCWIDEQTEDGETSLLPKELDEEMGWRGCATALISIGWAAEDEKGRVVALEFDKHSGETAKKRAENARRQSNFKERKRRSNALALPGNADALPNALPEENRREEKDKPYSDLPTEYTPDTSGEPPEAARAVPSIEEVMTVMQSLSYANLKGSKLRECAERWLDTMRSAGWRDSKNRIVHDWAANARNWARGYAETEAKQKRQKGGYTAPETMNVNYYGERD